MLVGFKNGAPQVRLFYALPRSHGLKAEIRIDVIITDSFRLFPFASAHKERWRAGQIHAMSIVWDLHFHARRSVFFGLHQYYGN